MKRPYKAMDVAKYIITKCTRDEHPISNLQLQKILYILQKEYLQRDQKCLFFDDFEAWVFGPNIPNVYYYFCGFGSMPIQAEYDIKLDLKDTKIIDPVVERKRNLKPWDLLPETQNGAWNIVYQKGEQNVIPLSLIKQLEIN